MSRSHRLRVTRLCVTALVVLVALAVPVTAVAKRHAPAPAPTRVTVEVLPDSVAMVHIPAIPLPGGTFVMGTDSGSARDIPLSGRFTGVVKGGFLVSKTNKVQLRSGRIGLGATDLLTDASCGGAPVLRTDPASSVTIDPKRSSIARLSPTGAVHATVHLLLRLAVQSRMLTGCDAGLVPMGYATTPLTLKLEGQILSDGLARIQLRTTGLTNVGAAVCLTPGSPTSPCTALPLGYPVAVEGAVNVKVAIGAS